MKIPEYGILFISGMKRFWKFVFGGPVAVHHTTRARLDQLRALRTPAE